MNLPLRARVYLYGVVAAGVASFLAWCVAWRGPLPASQGQVALMALLGALAVAAIHFPLQVRPRQKESVAIAVYLADLLLFGAPAAVALIGASQMIGGVTLGLRRRPRPDIRLLFAGTVFNAGQFMAAAGVSAAVYYTALPHTAPAAFERFENLWALPAAAVALFLVNTGAVAVMIGLQRGENPLRIWVTSRRTDVLHFVGLMPIGVVAALAAVRYPWTPLVMAVPAAMLHLSLKHTLRLVQQAEELAKREAEAAALRELDRMKDELLSTISHELRTPLTLVHGYAQMLQRDARAFDPRVVEETARRIVAGSAQLNRLVTDLVDFGRAGRGELEVQVEPFDLASLVNDLAPSYQVRTGGRLRVEMAGCLDVCGDCVRVAQIVSNLLDNAAKYAPGGPITLRAVRADGTVRVEVVDRGPGIPAHEQARVWEKFFRSAQVTEQHLVKGSGIGLAVVKALVEAQGGRVGLQSAPGQGSSFWFELPAMPAAEQARPAAAALGISMRTQAPAGGLHNHAASA